MECCGLYIHVPFCLQKCNYCDFISFPYQKELADQYLLALFSEITLISQKYNHPQLETIYLGGGTPTCFSGEELAQIINAVRESFSVNFDEVEITCELNPATGVEKNLSLMKEAGINRLSIGVQSFDDSVLQYLGRIHNVNQVLNTYHKAREIGFKNINLDLIFAIPDQTLKGWKETLKTAIELKPDHLSLYNLKIEEDTPFYQDYLTGKLKPIDEELDFMMYEEAIKVLNTAGLSQYEISNFARPGFESRHNQRYWHYLPYLAVGPGAHGFDGTLRYANTGDLQSYIQTLQEKCLPWQEEIHLSQKDLMEEFMIMGLRLNRGIRLAEFVKRFGVTIFDIYDTQIKKLTMFGLIECTDDFLALTSKGVPLGNEVFTEFLL